MLIESNTIYPTVNSNITTEQIKKIFTPNNDEILFAYNNTSNKKYQLLLLVLLKSYQKYRRFIHLLDLSFDVIVHVANILNFQEIKSGVRVLQGLPRYAHNPPFRSPKIPRIKWRRKYYPTIKSLFLEY